MKKSKKRQKYPTLHEDFDVQKAVKILSKQDPKIASIIKKVGAFSLQEPIQKTAYRWLLRSIIFQQLHAKAAATIHQRVQDLFGGKDPTPKQLLAMSEEKLRSAGLSRQKLAALKDLARAAFEGRVPSMAKIYFMEDEEIIEHLIRIRGVGRWTVEMLLIFGLGRRDVLAVDDFAIKKATMLLYKMKEMPDRKTMVKIGENWKPYRSIACWYLWRSVDIK